MTEYRGVFESDAEYAMRAFEADTPEQALEALNTAPRFKVPNLGTDSYKIADIRDRALAKAKAGVA
jgi:hypothetical protein